MINLNETSTLGGVGDARAITKLLDEIYGPFRAEGRWPVATWVRRRLRRDGLDFDSLVDDLPEAWMSRSRSPFGFPPGDELRLTLEGIAHCTAGQFDVDLLVSAIAALVAIDAQHETTDPFNESSGLTVTGHQVFEAMPGYTLNAVDATRLYLLLRTETSIFGSSSPPGADGEWQAEITDHVAAYSGAVNAEDLSRAREGRTPRRAVSEPPSEEVPYVFIVMPFGESWSAAVHDLIEETLARVHELRPMTWERADDIAAPGHITAQIIESIARADIIVADVTGNNPNVMFELGYADALGKPIVLMNQVIAGSPFDIHDWRQVEYAASDLRAARIKLFRAVVSALPVPPLE